MAILFTHRAWGSNPDFSFNKPTYYLLDYGDITTHVVCVNFIRKWQDLQFNVERRTTDFLRNLCIAGLFTLRVFVRNLEIVEEIFFFIFRFLSLTWETNPGFSSNNYTHYVLDTATSKVHNTVA